MWLTVIQTKWEREGERKRITKTNNNRLREWKKQTKKRIRVTDKMKILENGKKQKTKIYQKYVYRGDTKINKVKK